MGNKEADFIMSIICFFLVLTSALVMEKHVKISCIDKQGKKCAYIVAVIGAFIIFFLFGNHTFNLYNNYSYLAKALLKGRIDVPDMPDYLESVMLCGKKYMHFAPGGALLSIPFVAIFGVEHFNCAHLAMALGACNFVLAIGILNNLKIGRNAGERIWLTSMLIFGTVHFFCAAQGSSWFLGHVSALFFLLVSLYYFTRTEWECRAKNLFFSGLFFGLAVTCRLTTLFGAVFFGGYLLATDKRGKRDVIIFGFGAAVFGSLYMIYNYIRFGTIMDMGYQLTYLKDMHREAYDMLQAAPLREQQRLLKTLIKEYGGPLQLKFIKNNLYSILFLLPEFQKEFPYVIPTQAGVAVTFTSPMLYCAVLADWKNKLVWILGGAAILTAIPFLMNYGNGMAQFGMRYSMDFTPYLWLLMCLGLTRKGKLEWWMKIGIAACIFIQGWGTLFWTYFYT